MFSGITTVGYDGEACPPGAYGDIPRKDAHRLNAFFSCMNQRNEGTDISSVVLWSGVKWRRKLEQVKLPLSAVRWVK